MVQFLFQTGLRLDECSQLMLSDIEFGECSGRVIVRSGKGNKARTVPLNASARLALAVYLAPQRGFCGEKMSDSIYTHLHPKERTFRSYMVRRSAPKEAHDSLPQAIATSLRQGE